jgi:4-alpha-glucanotransferase
MNLTLQRSSGVQLHPTSLPGGRLGREAYAFVDWLHAAGQSWWQMLPLGPPDRYGSPYKARSAFAAWPGLLAEPRAPVSAAEVSAFREKERFWIDDWARHGPGRADELIAEQVRFDREWAALRTYAADRGVRLIGDVPIYVAPGSADHRAHPKLFRDDAVAGVPPDAFTDKGQLWGNPLYDWPALRADGRYRWWTERLRRIFELYDVARIDHFRGFVAYWAVPRGARDARGGIWKRGPGRAVFDAASDALGGTLPLIAEDLGVITPAVERLRDDLGYPGMAVLQFAFDGDPANIHLPEHQRANQVVYTGTHDHDTALGWWESADEETRARAQSAIDAHGVAEPEPQWSLIRLAFASPARLAMVQAQDVVGLGSEARMNFPGTASGAWKWRLEDGALTPALAERLRAATEAAERLGA